MLLVKITLEEFGAYQGRQSLDLSTEKNRPVILIGGLNGCGKTTLLDAIQLVLYGPRARCSGRGNRSYESYLRESINRQADPTRGAAITLEFTAMQDGREHYYRVVRSWRISGKNLKEFLNVYIDEEYGQNAEDRRNLAPEGRYSKSLSEGWADFVEDLLPLEVASLSFFDGEKIESLADPDRASSVIESAVHSLLGASTVEQLRTDLQALQRRQKLSGEEQAALEKIRELERDLKRAQEQFEGAHQKQAEVRSARDSALRDLESIERAFEKEGGSFFERRIELEAEKAAAVERLAGIRTALIKVAEGPLPLLMLGEQLASLHEQAQRERDAAESREVLDVLRERDRWIADLLSEDEVPSEVSSAVRKKLEADRRKRARTARLTTDLALPRDILSQLTALDQALASDQERSRVLLNEARDVTEQLDQLDRQLAAVPARNKVEALQQARSEHQAAVALSTVELERATQKAEELRRRRETISAALERAHQEYVQTEIREEEIGRVVKYSEKARDTLEHFKKELVNRHISRLEVAVLRSFSELMRKQGLIKDLRIDPEKFTLTLTDAYGEDIDPGRLSAGERQLLAVSLLWGVMKVAGNHLPSVIDTPLGRLDSRHREHLVDRYFPYASHQVLLLSTDEEIDEHLLDRLNSSIARTYTLVHDDCTFTTSVVEGYWWKAGALHAPR